jgi:hypothetical protein
MRILPLAAAFVLPAALALAQAPPPPQSNAEQIILMRGLVEAVRANTEAAQKTSAALETLTNRVERLEAAMRGIPPSIEGVRTDIIAMRALLERIASGQGARRPAATLRFSPFACGTQTEQACAAAACKSVGYASGLSVTAIRNPGAAATVAPVGIQDATCYDQ